MEWMFAILLLAIAGSTLQSMALGALRAIGAVFMIGMLIAWLS